MFAFVVFHLGVTYFVNFSFEINELSLSIRIYFQRCMYLAENRPG